MSSLTCSWILGDYIKYMVMQKHYEKIVPKRFQNGRSSCGLQHLATIADLLRSSRLAAGSCRYSIQYVVNLEVYLLLAVLQKNFQFSDLQSGRLSASRLIFRTTKINRKTWYILDLWWDCETTLSIQSSSPLVTLTKEPLPKFQLDLCQRYWSAQVAWESPTRKQKKKTFS